MNACTLQKFATIGAILLMSTPAMADEKSENQEQRAAMRRTHSEDLKKEESRINRATEVYRSVLRGKEGEVPASVLQNAKCIAIFPDTVTAAIGVGGTRGEGVAYCKNAADSWGGPAMVTLTGGSIGVQAGVKSTDIVLFVSSVAGREALQSGKFQVTGELSAVAGSYDQNFQMGHKGVVSYVSTSGAFIGASLDGVDVSRSEEREREFYGESFSKNRIFESDLASNSTVANNLRKALP